MPPRVSLSLASVTHRSILCLVALLALFQPSLVRSQVVATGAVPNAETATPAPGGHDYLHFLGETVSPANGSVNFNIQYPMPKGRGISVPYSFSYNSASLYRLTETPLQLTQFLPNGLTNVNWPIVTWTEASYTPPPVSCTYCNPPPPPFAQCNYATGFTFIEFSGTSHSLGLAIQATVASQWNNPGFTTTVCGQGNTVPANSGTASSGGSTGDGEVSAIFSNQATSVSDVANWQFCNTCDPQASGPVGPFTVTDASGITYFFDGICTFDWVDHVCEDLAYQFEDRNGNLVNGNGDTLGRSLVSGSANGIIIGGITYPNPSCASCPPLTGNTNKTNVSYTPPSQSVQSSGWGEVIDCAQNTPGSSMTVNGTQAAWSGVGLPDGTQYTFYFGQFNPTDSSILNNYGLINEIVFPGGGWIKYIWKMSNANGDPNNTYTQLATFSGVGETSHNIHPACFTRYGAPVLANRMVSYDGSTVAQTQVFHYATNWVSNWGPSNPSDWTTKSTTVTTTDNLRNKSFTTVYNYGAAAQPGGSAPFTMGGGVASNIPIETSIQYYDWNGALLRTVTKSWFDLFHLSEEDVTLDNGQTSKTTYTYTGGTCGGVGCSPQSPLFPIRMQNKSEYDYNGSLIRSTTTSYQTFGLSPNLTPVPPQPSSVVIAGPSGPVAETDYLYDGTAPTTPSSGVIQHDSYYGGGFNARGNLTTKTQKCSSGTGCAGDAITTYTYDIAGQVTSLTAPCGHGSCSDMPTSGSFTTSYSYTDQGTNTPGSSDAYVTQITYPPTNGVSHVEHFSYNYTFGDLISSTDQNGLTTGYQYEPKLDRLAETDSPDGGKTTITYSGASSITTSQLITSAGPPKTTVSTMDGMFHVIKTQITSDSPCLDTTDTAYDGEGRALQRSNPHCQSESVNWTQYDYDTLGRNKSVLETDNSIAGTAYSGASVTTTDEVSNQRRSLMDGVGRLIEVDEPGTASGAAATPATGSFSVGGNEQSIIVGPPTAGTGSVTVSGTEQSWQTQTAPATSSSGNVTISGSLQSKQVQTQWATSGAGGFSVQGGPDDSKTIDPCYPYGSCPQTVYNGGTISVTVNGYTSTAGYDQNSTLQSLASALASGFNNSSSPVNASAGGGGVSVTAKATGASTNYSFSTSATWISGTCPDGNPCFYNSSFYISPGSGALGGGRDNAYTTVYDHGTTTITMNGQPVSYSWSGSGTTAASIAQGLASAVNSSSSYATASASGSTVYLTSRGTGASVNYSLSSSSSWDTSNFGSSSFGTGNSGGSMTGGADPQYTTNWDSGTVSVTVNGHATSYNWSGSGTTSSTIASGLAQAVNQDGSAAVNASASGPAVNFVARTSGPGTNYSLSTSTSSQRSSFSSSASGSALTGGASAPVQYDTGTASVTVGSFTATANYGSGSTANSIATALASAFSGSGISATASGTSVALTTSQTGSAANLPLSVTSATSQPGTFSTSFSVAPSGPSLTGGTDQGTSSVNSPAITLYGYDTLNNLVCVVENTGTTAFVPTYANCQTAPPAWRPRWFQYDSMSHLVSSHNPETGNITYSYDLNGNVSAKTDARLITTNYSYDQLNRLTQKSYQNDPNNTAIVKYGYDGVAGAVNCAPTLTPVNPLDRRTSMCDAAGTESWSYPMTPNVGWETVDRRTTNGITKTITTQDNLDGSVASITYPSNRTVNYTYNGAARPVSAVDTADGINYVTNAGYTAFGSVSGLTNGGSITVANTYNPRMQPWHLNATNSQGGQILSFTYDFHLGSDNGNVYQIANGRDANRTQNFTYDALNRIAEAWTSGPNWGERFTIDPWGNLTNRDPIPGKTYYEPLSAAPALANNQLTGYGYNASGDMTQNQGASYFYDAEEHLTSTAGLNYTYDGDGNRVMKSNGTVYWGSGPLAESDASGYILREYIFFNGKRVARLDVPTNTQHYYFANHLGSTSVVTNASGTAPFDEDLDYYPYGGVVAGSAENIPQNYKFNGKERDSESGLDNFGARFDASTLGRFMTPDWAEKPTAVPYANFGNPQSLNLYAFAKNNPTTFGDPDGHIDCSGKNAQGVGCKLIAQWKAMFGTATQLLNDGIQRSKYTAAAARLSGPNASAERRALQANTYKKLSPIGKSITDAAKESRAGQLAGKTAEQLIESAPRTNPGINAIGDTSKVLGGVGVALSVGAVVKDTIQAPEGQKGDTAVKGGLTLGFSYGGAEMGAMVGAELGPPGAIGGSLIGGFAGSSMMNAKPPDWSPQEQELHYLLTQPAP